MCELVTSIYPLLVVGINTWPSYIIAASVLSIVAQIPKEPWICVDLIKRITSFTSDVCFV